MSAALYRNHPTFRAAVDEGLRALPTEVADEIRQLCFADELPADAGDRLLRPSLQLPAILITEVATARAWAGFGVTPAALIGHSMGENAAACLAGVMSFADAVRLVRLRGELFETVDKGGMLAVPLSATALTDRLPAELDLASVNAPELCVVSGPSEALAAFAKKLAQDGIDATPVPIDIAAHSRMLEPILERFGAFLRGITLNQPAIPTLSNLTGTWLSAADACDPAYWVRHLRGTVLFADGLRELAREPGRIFIEAGPGRALSSLAKAQGFIPGNQVINSLPHPDDRTAGDAHLLGAVGRAWAVGLPVELDRIWTGRPPLREHLPTYPFQHQRYFIDIATPEARADAKALLREPDMATWGYRPSWTLSAPEILLGQAVTGGNWLVFLDDTGLGSALVNRLREAGNDVVCVTPGDAFRRRARDSYVLCPEAGREGYDALLAGLVSDDFVPTRIVHLWLVTAGESHRPGSSFFHRNVEMGFESLFGLSQAIGSGAWSGERQITVVTNGMQRVGEEALPYPEKALVTGPALVTAREMAGTHVRLIDIPVPPAQARSWGVWPSTSRRQTVQPHAAIVDMLLDDLFGSFGTEVVAYRQGRRWRHGYAQHRLPEVTEATISWKDGGVYLITGGLGEIALELAKRLAAAHRARLVLLGRGPSPDDAQQPTRRGKAAQAAFRAIRAAGGEVAYVQGDVTVLESVQAAIRVAHERFGRLDAVLHSAGLMQDGLMQVRTLAEAKDVLAPKVQGTMVLLEALAGTDVERLVLFSSTSTITAPAGQGDYVAANAFLDAVAQGHAGSKGPRVVAVQWGVWRDVGLAARAVAGPADEPIDQPSEALPLFERVARTGEGTDYLGTWSPQTDWLLNEHRLASGEALVPGTGYLEAAVQAMTAEGNSLPLEITDALFLSPLHVPDGDHRHVALRLQTEGDHARWSLSSDGGSAGEVTHAEGSIRALRGEGPMVDLHALRQRFGATGSVVGTGPLRTVQEDLLRFGPRWGTLQQDWRKDGEALGALELAAKFIGDIAGGFVLHPAVLDIATGFALDLAEGYRPGEALWIPWSYSAVRVFRPLAARVWSWVRLKQDISAPGTAAFDVTIVDEAGDVLVEVEALGMKRVSGALDLAASQAPARRRAAGHSRSHSPGLAEVARQVELGIAPDEGLEALTRAMATGEPQVVVSPLSLDILIERAQARAQASAPANSFERPDLETEFIAPRDEVERKIAGFWLDLLGVDKVGVRDSFFDLGGHSLLAVRLFRMIKQEFAVDLPISALFEAPTIEDCAALLRRAGSQGPEGTTQPSRPSLRHVVQMSPGPGGPATPLFICAGMFGNVLNLRHLALQVGQERPVFGLQARGLFGGDEPHDNFDDMARDYIAEIRTVQPHGPYLLAGFSGGGLVAYEMARQLRDLGEEVRGVLMLDTPRPLELRLSSRDRLAMRAQDFGRDGWRFLLRWLRTKEAYRRSMRDRRQLLRRADDESFHNEKISASFYSALKNYVPRPFQGRVTLFKPRAECRYVLSGNRRLNAHRMPILPDNGWGDLVENLKIVDVPGDHDSMVLEPFVRTLAREVSRELATADVRQYSPRLAAE